MLRIAAFRSLLRSNVAVVMVVSPKLVCGTSAGMRPGRTVANHGDRRNLNATGAKFGSFNPAGARCRRQARGPWSTIRKSRYRFSEKIMLRRMSRQ